MDSHFVGSTGKSLIPDPSPDGRRGTSWVVRRFMDAVRGEAVHKPANPFRVVKVVGEERYCMGCCGVRWHDVVLGYQVSGSRFQVGRCRVCGKEGAL